jgi:RNA polymerase sigma factor (sigma-70 family)
MKEEQAFVELIKQNEGIIHKITRLYTDDNSSREDLYQEIVYQLWKGFKTFRGEALISTWLYRVALNTALLNLKKNKKRGRNVSLEFVQLKEEVYDPVVEERLKVLYATIRKLGDIERGIIFLFLEGKKYQEIALITGLTSSNVGTRIARIKHKLRTQMVKD